MLFVSRFLVAAGAILAPVRDSTRPDPGGLTGLSRQGFHRISSASQARAASTSPVLKAGLPTSALQLAWLKGRGRPTTRPSTPPIRFLPHPTPRPSSSTALRYANQTLAAPGAVVFGVANYDGPKGITLVDERRALALYRQDEPRDLAVYNRPNSLTLYAGPINYIQFWVDPRHYQVVTYVYRPRFADCFPMFRQYAHLESRDFARWAYQATDDPIEAILADDRSVLREVFNLVPSRYITIGDSKRRPEEQAARVLTRLYAFGALVSLVLIAFEEYSELRKALAERNRSSDFAQVQDFDFVASLPIYSHIELEHMWWEEGKGESDVRVDSTDTYVDTSLPSSASNMPTSTSDSVIISTPAEAPQAPGPSRRPPPNKSALSQRLSGPRFKSAAWKRCRVK